MIVVCKVRCVNCCQVVDCCIYVFALYSSFVKLHVSVAVQFLCCCRKIIFTLEKLSLIYMCFFTTSSKISLWLCIHHNKELLSHRLVFYQYFLQIVKHNHYSAPSWQHLPPLNGWLLCWYFNPPPFLQWTSTSKHPHSFLMFVAIACSIIC